MYKYNGILISNEKEFIAEVEDPSGNKYNTKHYSFERKKIGDHVNERPIWGLRQFKHTIKKQAQWYEDLELYSDEKIKRFSGPLNRYQNLFVEVKRTESKSVKSVVFHYYIVFNENRYNLPIDQKRIDTELLNTLQCTKADFRAKGRYKIGHDKERSLEFGKTTGYQKRSPKGFKVESKEDKDGKEYFIIVPNV